MSTSSRATPGRASNPEQLGDGRVGTGWKPPPEPPESLDEALTEAVRAAGGSKVVGAKLWPGKSVEDARRYLAACLNPERAEKLALEEIMVILRMAREAGCHIAVEFLLNDLCYAPPQPVEPEDKSDDLRRQFVAAVGSLSRMAHQIQMLDLTKPSRRST